jgi:LPXTG-site transpeptidase (sortase) family protein
MYERRRANLSVFSVLAGVVIVIAGVLGFFALQSLPPRAAESLPTNTPAVTLTAAATSPATSAAAEAPQDRFFIFANSINMSAMIVPVYFSDTEDNWDVSTLGDFAGHLEGTPDHGRGGNFVLAGHIELGDGQPGPFYKINELKVGDLIILQHSGNAQPPVQYSVTEVKTVEPTDFNILRNHGYEELTLITCSDWDEAAGVYNSRTVVHARPVADLANTSGSSNNG